MKEFKTMFWIAIIALPAISCVILVVMFNVISCVVSPPQALIISLAMFLGVMIYFLTKTI